MRDKSLLRERWFVGVLTILTLTHFLSLYKLGYPYTDFGTVLVTSDPLTYLLHNGFFDLDTIYRSQINYFTGNPFFLLPFFHIFGSGPASQRLVLIFFASLTTLFCVLAYRNIFSCRDSILGALVLLNFSAYLTFWSMDYSYVLAFTAFLLFLFTEWYENKRDDAIYLLAYFSGLFFYFKAIIAYIVISFIFSYILTSYAELKERLSMRMLFISFVLFLSGIFPFLVYSYGIEFAYIEDVSTAEENYDRLERSGYEPNLKNILGYRIKQLNYLLDPDTHYGLSEFPEPGIEFPSLITVGVIAAAVFTTFRTRYKVYSIGMILVFISSLYVTQGMNPQQLIVLIPFVPIVIISVIDILIKNDYEDIFYIIMFLLLVIGFLNSLESLNESVEYTTPRESDLEQSLYEDFELTNIEGDVATNTWTVYQAASYSLAIKERKFISSEDDIPDTPFSVHLSRDRKDIDDNFENTTLLLYGGESCPESFCGYNSQKIMDELQITESSIENISIGETKYLLVRN